MGHTYKPHESLTLWLLPGSENASKNGFWVQPGEFDRKELTKFQP